MTFTHNMTLSLFMVWKSPYEVLQTSLTIVEASTTCTTSERNCDTMVPDFFYPEIYFSRERRKGEGMGS